MSNKTEPRVNRGSRALCLGIGFLCCSLVGCSKSLPAPVEKKLEATFCKPSPTWAYPPRPPARTIKFPEEEIGTLYTTTAGISYVGSYSWRRLGPAQGNIVLPAGTAAYLEVKTGMADQLAAIDLAGIQVIDFSAPFDFPYELYVNHQTKRVVKLSDSSLQPLAKTTTLYRLILHNTTITDDGLAFIAEVKSLRSINLFNTRITDEGLHLLAELPHLEGLDLGATGISDKGLQYLGNCPKLERVNLTGSNRTKGNQSATAYSANRNITDRGIAYLSKLHSLTELDISNANVSDRSLDALSELKSLRVLDVSGTMISKRGVRKLRKNLPNCRVIDDPGITDR